MRCARRQRLPGKADAAPCVRACVCECRRPSACGCYLYRPLHANGSCETSQTFFPTVTSHQSGRGTRGPEGGRTDGSWSAPSHWSPPPCSRWRPMAHSREGGGLGRRWGAGGRTTSSPSIITPFYRRRPTAGSRRRTPVMGIPAPFREPVLLVRLTRGNKIADVVPLSAPKRLLRFLSVAYFIY